jgi:copper chaperone NosL
MSSRARILVAVAALLTAAAFLFPLWNVYLDAPQYPEGLGMRIWVNRITGIKPNDLDNINNLNHYIGMKRIEPESIKELRFMPFLLGSLAMLALVAALVRRRALLRVWLAAFVALAVAGLADFWKWEYDYGHNLDLENAIIKVPGMNYQPPLIGSKQLLNFRATSLPALGSIALFTAFSLAVAALVVDRRRGVIATVARADRDAAPALVA